MTDELKIKLAAREIKRILGRVRRGERDVDQALIDIGREADFILAQLVTGELCDEQKPTMGG